MSKLNIKLILEVKEKKNLIIFLPNFTFGGAGNSVCSLINYLNNNEFTISVICIGNCQYKSLFNKKIHLYELKNKSLFLLFPKIISIIINTNMLSFVVKFLGLGPRTKNPPRQRFSLS